MATNRYGDLFEKLESQKNAKQKENKYGDIMNFAIQSSGDRYDGLLERSKPTRGYDALLNQEAVKEGCAALFESEGTGFKDFVNSTMELQATIKKYREKDSEEARQFVKELEYSFKDIARRKLLSCYFVYYKLGEKDRSRTIVFVFGNMDECEEFVKRTPGKYLGTKDFYDFTRLFEDGWKNIDNYHYDGHTLYFYD